MARRINYSDDNYNPNLVYTCFDGTRFELKPNSIEGLTEEVITVIRQLNKKEHDSDLNERYLEDPRFATIKWIILQSSPP